MGESRSSNTPPSSPGLEALVTRRYFLKGTAVVITAAAVAPLLVACGAGGVTPIPSIGGSPAATGGASSSAAATGGASSSAAATGTVSLGSNHSDAVPKAALQSVIDAFQKESGIQVAINTVDTTKFQDQISSYLQGTPQDAFTWFAGQRMRFFAAQGLSAPIDDVWAKIGSDYSVAFQTASKGDDGHYYFLPFANYPWAVFYRPSVFEAKGYQIPKTFTDLKTLGDQMKKDGLAPMAFGDKDGWPAMGYFDILNLRINGYQFHVDLMAGKEKWTDPRVKTVFQAWTELVPYLQPGGLGRTFEDIGVSLLQKKAGMDYTGMFVAQQFTTPSDLADLEIGRAHV
jgi:multiple sugar transport system substrate-binding protein